MIQQPMVSMPKWSFMKSATNVPGTGSLCLQAPQVVAPVTAPAHKMLLTMNANDSSDEHFNRHLENLTKLDDDSLELAENRLNEELNVAKLKKIIAKNAGHEDVDVNNVNCLNDDDEDVQGVEEEPKVFQDEEVDLVTTTNPPVTLLQQPITKPVLHQQQQQQQQQHLLAAGPSMALSKQTSTMPTPLAYSRSSSMTSLNSFDAKSIQSSVFSEYSCVKVNTNNNKKSDNGSDTDQDEEDDDDDLDNLMPDSPAAIESSFVKVNRIKHKQQQQICRQNAAAAMQPIFNRQTMSTAVVGSAWSQGQTTAPNATNNINQPTSVDLNSIMSRLTLQKPSEMSNNTPPIKLPQPAKFQLAPTTVTQPAAVPPIHCNSMPVMSSLHGMMAPVVAPVQPIQPAMSVTYAFMKNSQQQQTYQAPNVQQPKFLMSSTFSAHGKYAHTPLVQSIQPTKAISPPPQPAIDDQPRLYSIENRLPLNAKPPMLIMNPSQPSSPPESICSRMSDASIPSVIRQDIAYNTSKFYTMKHGMVAPQAPVPVQTASNTTNTNDFKALFNKLNTNRVKTADDEDNSTFTNRPYSSSSSDSSISSSKSQILAANRTMQPNRPEQSSNTPQAAKKPCLYIDDDLENFINENFQPAKSINTSYDENDFKLMNNPKQSIKRASLQNLDLTKSSSFTVNVNKSTVELSKAKSGAPVKKRLSEDNKPLTMVPSTTSRSVRAPRASSNSTSSTSSSTNVVVPPGPVGPHAPPGSLKPTQKQTVSTAGQQQPPVINMTKTAQLRASTNKKQAAQVGPNRPIQNKQLTKVSRDALNQTQLSSSSAASSGSSRRISFSFGQAGGGGKIQPTETTAKKESKPTTSTQSTVNAKQPVKLAAKSTTTTVNTVVKKSATINTGRSMTGSVSKSTIS